MGDNEPELNISLLLTCKTSFTPGETITSLDGTKTNFFIGTSFGNVYNVSKSSTEFAFTGVARVGNVAPVTQIKYLSALEIVIVICGGCMVELSVAPERFLEVYSTQKNVGRISLNTGLVIDNEDDPFCVHLAVATGKTINLCRKTNNGMHNRVYHKITANESVKDVVYNGNTVCFATSSYYYVHDVSKNQTIDLFPIDNVSNIQICGLDESEFLVFISGIGMIVNSEGMSTRPPLVFSESSIISCCFKSPTIRLLSKEHILFYGRDDSQLDQTVTNGNGCHLIFEVEGQIFACNSCSVFQMAQASFNKHIERLIAKGQLEKALEECEKEYHLSPKDEIIEKALELKKRLALKMIDESDWNLAHKYLISGNVNPKEIMHKFDEASFEKYHEDTENSDEFTRDKVEFLRNYLSEVQRQDFIDADHKKEIEKLRMRYGIFVDGKKFTSENHLTMADILKSRQNFAMAGKHLMCGGNVEGGLECWSEVDNFDLIKSTIECLSEKSDVEKVLHWLLDKFPDETILFLETSKLESWPLLQRAELFEKHPKIYKTWLKKHSNNPDLDCRLLLLLCEDIIKGNADSFSSRKELRSILLDIVRTNVKIGAEVKDKLSLPLFSIESRLIEYKPTRDEAIETIKQLLEENDVDTAESFVSIYADDHPIILQNLFTFYKKNQSADSWMRLIKYLDKVKNSTIAIQLFEEIPESLKMLEVSNSLKNLISRKVDMMESTLIKKVAQKNLINQQNESKKMTTRIMIAENEKCAACEKELEFNHGTISYLPSGYVVHTSCIRYPGLCPVTNLVFNSF